MNKVAVIGTGIMGSGIAANFIKNGYDTFVWNRTPEKTDKLVSIGALLCETPAEAASKADIVFEVTGDDESSRKVWLGKNGILQSPFPNPSKYLITSASLSINWVDELIKRSKLPNVIFFDMPLTGGRAGAESGKLKLLVGGSEGELSEIRSDLAAISDAIYYFGPAGSGMRFKLILNSLSAIHINAAAQAIELAKKVGLSADKFYEAIFDGDMAPASPATKILLNSASNPSNGVNFSVKWIEKDLRYALEMAEDKDVNFDLLKDTQEDYAKAKNANLADEDWTKIITLFS